MNFLKEEEDQFIFLNKVEWTQTTEELISFRSAS